MPVMDGFMATKLIREKYNIDTPIIGLSANVYKEDVEKCIDAGMNGHIGKPIDETELYSCILKWCFDQEGSHDRVPKIPPLLKTKEDFQLNKYTDIHFLVRISEGEHETVIKMIERYLDQVEKHITSMKESWQDGNLERIYNSAHNFKSNLKIAGTYTLLEYLEQIESSISKKTGLDEIPALINKIAGISDIAKKELNEELKKL